MCHLNTRYRTLQHKNAFVYTTLRLHTKTKPLTCLVGKKKIPMYFCVCMCLNVNVHICVGMTIFHIIFLSHYHNLTMQLNLLNCRFTRSLYAASKLKGICSIKNSSTKCRNPLIITKTFQKFGIHILKHLHVAYLHRLYHIAKQN